jgi:uncharacterized protein (TIGR03437 family)
MNSLTVTASPSIGAMWHISPASPDGFYDSQTKVVISVTPRPGYRFSSWSGDLSGSSRSASLTMNVPHSVVAEVTAAPSISRGGSTSSSTRMSPQTAVAAGSVASVFGDSLAAGTASGPASPLARSLAGVSVHIGTRLLPLFFVSPAQINFQVPADLAPGAQTLTVTSPDMADLTTDLTIVRDAPELFPAVDGQIYAMVMHEDGTPVTAAAPARQGELLTVYGTGFGPTDRVRPEATAVPAAPHYMILDPVTIEVGASVLVAESAFAAPGHIGVDMVQFRLDSTAPSGAAIPFYVTVNGVSSNTLTLPIQ